MEDRGAAPSIKWEMNGDFAILSFGNPPQNYIRSPAFVGLDALRNAVRDERVKALIVKGDGRHFSAGADIERATLQARRDALADELAKGREVLDCLSLSPIPSVAMVTGVCFGAGLEIALACHIRIASENATFGFPEADRGLMPGLTGTFRLPMRVGKGRALELILASSYIDAAKALDLGLVDYVTPKNRIMDFTIDLLKKMTDNRSSKVIRYITRSINNAYVLSPEKAMEEEAKMFCELAKDFDRSALS